ncbi:MAG TPA: hypothetical protein VGR28_09660 [Candidatus Thermoplasmatota archaeon]|jgi:hypothetical protein|nr:hypothetical protein [Candidatus Thermoplasmatota archaeon]
MSPAFSGVGRKPAVVVMAFLLASLATAATAAADHIGGAHPPLLIDKPALGLPLLPTQDAPCVAAPGLEVLCAVLDTVFGLQPRSATAIPLQVQCISLWPWSVLCQAVLP